MISSNIVKQNSFYLFFCLSKIKTFLELIKFVICFWFFEIEFEKWKTILGFFLYKFMIAMIW